MKEKGFNMMQKHGMPEWEKASHNTIKKDCMQVYKAEKKKLKGLLKTINKNSLMTDLWKLSNQKIEYMVLTARHVNETLILVNYSRLTREKLKSARLLSS